MANIHEKPNLIWNVEQLFNFFFLVINDTIDINRYIFLLILLIELFDVNLTARANWLLMMNRQNEFTFIMFLVQSCIHILTIT